MANPLCQDSCTKDESKLSFSSHSSNSDFMRFALAQGRLALHGCLPNPPVNCVLIRDNLVISQGHTQSPGL